MEDVSIRKPLSPITLRPTDDLFMVREDQVRATHSETRTSYSNDRMTTTVQVSNAYHRGVEIAKRDNIISVFCNGSPHWRIKSTYSKRPRKADKAGNRGGVRSSRTAAFSE